MYSRMVDLVFKKPNQITHLTLYEGLSARGSCEKTNMRLKVMQDLKQIK
jgi:hypothetical protein